MSPTTPGSPADALLAVSRLLSAALGASGPGEVQQLLLAEARPTFGATDALLLGLGGANRSARVLHADPVTRPGRRLLWTDAVPALNTLIGGRVPWVRADPVDLGALSAALHRSVPPADALLVPMRTREALELVLVLISDRPDAFGPEVADVVATFAAAAASSLTHWRVAEEQAQRTAQQAALARAGKTLNADLDLATVLSTICREAKAIFSADRTVVYRGDAVTGLFIEAEAGFEGDVRGYMIAPGQGLSGKVVLEGRPLLTNDYAGEAGPAKGSPFDGVTSCIAVPMHWDGVLRGVLSVGFTHLRLVTQQDLALLEAFAELAAAACRNASAVQGLAIAARTDGLTGCLNHAAMFEVLDREMIRARRTSRPLSVILLDLDEFKQVNEREGHRVGDEVLRRVGHALRLAVRPYDAVARYGGDEFAIIAADLDEAGAAEVATRAIARVADALSDLRDVVDTAATAGIAELAAQPTPAHLLEDADRALLHGKQVRGRGSAVRASTVPGHRAPDGGRRPDGVVAPTVTAAVQADRLEQRTRQLRMANQLGARLSAMTDATEIVEAVTDELHRAFGYFLTAAVRIREDDRVEAVAARGDQLIELFARGWSQPKDDGIIGRCLRERHVVCVNDVRREPGYTATEATLDVVSELCAPVWVGDRLWGALNLEEVHRDAFGEDDARLLQTVAAQVGSALRSAELYEQLERAYLGTAEALANALEAKDAYTAHHARSIVQWAEAVGGRMGMDAEQLRDLRYGAVFHDIGKIAVPEAILDKRGSLAPHERVVMERHTVVGEQILAPVEFLAGVLPIVRHEHERWDGAGYPDRLRGEQIPLGARIVLVCDAFHAMTSDRPYRAAMERADARAELERHAGEQFDPEVVAAFCEVLDTEAQVAPARHVPA